MCSSDLVRDAGGGFGHSAAGQGRSAADGGIGLISMKERMGRIGGTLQITSSAEGTLIQASKALAAHDFMREHSESAGLAASPGSTSSKQEGA